MKAYKIDLSGFTGKIREVVSEAIAEHGAFLGYQKPNYTHHSLDMIALGGDGIAWGWKEKTYDALTNHISITADAFLSLATAKDDPVFKPFDKVLTRDTEDSEWACDMFSHMSDDTRYPYQTITGVYKYCIPYEGNEALLGTTDSPK